MEVRVNFKRIGYTLGNERPWAVWVEAVPLAKLAEMPDS